MSINHDTNISRRPLSGRHGDYYLAIPSTQCNEVLKAQKTDHARIERGYRVDTGVVGGMQPADMTRLDTTT